MNKRQKWTLLRFTLVAAVTLTAVGGMVELKNGINREESMRAMEQLGRVVSEYKTKNGCVPPESYVEGLKEQFEGQVRLGDLHYRARWIEVDSPNDTILAYARKNYHSLFSKPGVAVLLFDGKVLWMNKKPFDKKLSSQEKPDEAQISPK
jgi:hypothetical protein